MRKPEPNQRWVYGDEIDKEKTAEGIERKMLAYCKELMCVENHFATGAVGALHCHPNTQLTYVARGRFLFTIGEEQHEVKAGDTLLKQDGISHGCQCLEEGLLLDFFTPMREDFV